jgi:hypothetical protein
VQRIADVISRKLASPVAPRVLLVVLLVGFGAHRLAGATHETPLLGNSALLAPSLRIVDPSIAHGTELAEAIRVGGIGAETYSPQALLGETTPGNWWITKDAAQILEPSDVERLLATGSNLLIDGVTPISSALLGLQCSARVDAKNITVPCAKTTTESGTGSDSTPNELALSSGEAKTGGDANIRVLTVSNATLSNIAVRWAEPAQRAIPSIEGVALEKVATGEPALWRSKQGNILWSLPSLSGASGPQELPYLLQALKESFGIAPRVERTGWDLYADPDDYQSQTPTELADSWAEAGVHRVYLAGWKQNEMARTRYDYKTLVDLLHARDIEAYAWLAWPYVDTSMLIKYPECQERTASGTLAEFGGHGFVALTIPECFDKAWLQSARLLGSANFDGTNIVNLAFSSVYSGQKSPEVYTPFHPLVRAAFQREHGFDPVSLVRPGSFNWIHHPTRLAAWETYRSNELAVIYEKLLSRLQSAWPKRAVAITAMDDRNDPVIGALLRKNSGRSTDALFSLQKTYPFELILGDELDFRADLSGDVVKQYVHSGSKPPTMLLSLSERQATNHPRTARAGGLELYTKLSTLSSVSSNVALNPQGPLPAADLVWLKHAFAPGVELRVEGDRIFSTSKTAFRLLLHARARGLTLDGKAIPAADSAEVPAGEHVLEVQR